MVASFTGAWIETLLGGDRQEADGVASFTGAWIETKKGLRPERHIVRRVLHGRVD